MILNIQYTEGLYLPECFHCIVICCVVIASYITSCSGGYLYLSYVSITSYIKHISLVISNTLVSLSTCDVIDAMTYLVGILTS